MNIQNYSDFVKALLDCGFSLGGGSGQGIFSLITWDWKEEPPYDTPVRWHTGDPGTDPWEWRIRVLEERDDIAYGKVFFKKSGYISKEWYPYFLAARRGKMSFAEKYEEGGASPWAKRIYQVLQEEDAVPLHSLKKLAGFSGEEKSQFERALVELQMGLFITMCGRQQKISQAGAEYGWSSTVFCVTERFWDGRVFSDALKIREQEAIDKIAGQVYRLNPQAQMKKVLKFIKG